MMSWLAKKESRNWVCFRHGCLVILFQQLVKISYKIAFLFVCGAAGRNIQSGLVTADFKAAVADSHLLLGLDDFGFQISRDDSPSGEGKGSSKSSTYFICFPADCSFGSLLKQTSHLCSAGSGSLFQNPELRWLSWWSSGSVKKKKKEKGWSVVTRVGFNFGMVVCDIESD